MIAGKGGENMTIFRKTARLSLGNLRPADAEAIHAYRNDPVCYRYQRWEDTSPEAVQEFVEKFSQSQYLSHQEAHYAIRAGEGLIGDLSYFYTEGDCITLGITIAPAHQRKGYAAEVLRAVTADAREKFLKLDIVALIDPENKASIALFEKLGFTRECYAEKIDSYVYVLYGGKTMFYPVDDLKDGEICLKLKRTAEAQPEKRWLPAYYFDICLLSGEKIGYCDLRIGHNDKTYIGGNIGYGIDEAYRGHHYAAKACALLFRQARKHDMDHLFITCDPENAASARTCELAGGRYLETARIPEDSEMYGDGTGFVRVYRFGI